jgi:L-amino acid N-acyltransferase YncA
LETRKGIAEVIEMPPVEIHDAHKDDTDAIWAIFQAVIQTGDTYVFPPETPRIEMDQYWLAAHMRTYVAEFEDDVVGTYILKANHPGLGSHVANASYMVHPAAQGRGVGTAMCAHSLAEARRLGYRAMQFNLVVSTNEAAVHLWDKMGFSIVGTLPQAFHHQNLGYVDAYVMYQSLENHEKS